MRSKDNDMARLTQVICKRAGLVDGYDYSCRRCKRKGKPYVERRPDITKRKCPQCGMQLWVTVIPRPMRFHDTRHYADLRVMPMRGAMRAACRGACSAEVFRDAA
jgi:hypothetical protein